MLEKSDGTFGSNGLPRGLGHVQGDPPPYLLVMILSAPTQPAKLVRTALRRTWLTYGHRAAVTRHVKHVFVVGTGGLSARLIKALIAEKEAFGDLELLHGFVDSYAMLTTKLLLGIELAYREFGKYRFMLKVDGDTFVRLDKLLDVLEHVAEADKPRLYMGEEMRGAFPHQPGKVWDDTEWDLQSTYPPYFLGGGYIVSGPLLWAIAANRDIVSIYRNEDATMGLWLSSFNVSRKIDTRIDAMSSQDKSRPRPPRCKEDDLIEHRVSAEDIYGRDKALRSTDFGGHCGNSKNHCESCYGAESVETQCCPTCNAVRAAYKAKVWAFVEPGKGLVQCDREK